MRIAYCYASGQIEFGRSVPDGAIEIARGPAASLKKYIAATARLGYDNETLLVPGVPEAPDQARAGDALSRYMAWLGQRSVAGIVVDSVRATA